VFLKDFCLGQALVQAMPVPKLGEDFCLPVWACKGRFAPLRGDFVILDSPKQAARS
jgi:hypothetical protein